MKMTDTFISYTKSNLLDFNIKILKNITIL